MLVARYRDDPGPVALDVAPPGAAPLCRADDDPGAAALRPRQNWHLADMAR